MAALRRLLIVRQARLVGCMSASVLAPFRSRRKEYDLIM